MIFKCKLKDMADDLIQLGVTDIRLDIDGIGLGVAHYLDNKGINIKGYRLTSKGEKEFTNKEWRI